jgi:hypothetical protein
MTQITGMVFARREKYTAGLFCESCARHHFLRILVHNLVFGWWGVFSLLLTPIYTLENTVAYLRARGQLRKPRFDAAAIRPR